ncbi:MAG TPA: CoA pyrophosphatase [Anaerolineales bacterium]|nr:CoA pyrophosphatase [Anaerolineales bacterium]
MTKTRPIRFPFLSFLVKIHQRLHPPQPNMSFTFSEEYISQRLHEALQAAGPSSDGFSEVTLNEETHVKCAAVLIPLIWQNEEWHLLYTRRTDKVESHKGQVSFPGGACDDGETTSEQTALREAEEEIGIKPSDVKVLGRLANLITITYFRVTPVVGVVRWPNVFRVGEHEVARIFTIPLGWLANQSNRWQFERSDLKRALIVYHPYDGELVWGATARMTVDFLTALGY